MKKYGIKITLTQENPMRAEHLLGDGWETIRWYDDEESRDQAMQNMRKHLPNYRPGDTPAQVLEAIER